MKSSDTLIERLAVVALLTSVFNLMKSITSGWSHEMDTIRALLRPLLPIALAVVVKTSMNDTAPDVVLAALLILAPAGEREDTSTPTPPPALNVCAIAFAQSYMDSILSLTVRQ